MEFKKYTHVERYGTDETIWIEVGHCYIFPKIDGTNWSLWFTECWLQAWSRNRHLAVDDDNANFYKSALEDIRYQNFFKEFPNARLYWEWLTKHTIWWYRATAWRKFYVFDVEIDGIHIPVTQYEEMLVRHEIDYIPPIWVVKNPDYDFLLSCLKNNTYLMEDWKWEWEWIVIKNYEFINKYWRHSYAKLVGAEFKEQNRKLFWTGSTELKITEEEIANKFITEAEVEKTYAKIVTENNWWSQKQIPELLSRCFNDLVRENIWEILKEFKFPTINFKTLRACAFNRVKALKPVLF